MHIEQHLPKTCLPCTHRRVVHEVSEATLQILRGKPRTERLQAFSRSTYTAPLREVLIFVG